MRVESTVTSKQTPLSVYFQLFHLDVIDSTAKLES